MSSSVTLFPLPGVLGALFGLFFFMLVRTVFVWRSRYTHQQAADLMLDQRQMYRAVFEQVEVSEDVVKLLPGEAADRLKVATSALRTALQGR